MAKKAHLRLQHSESVVTYAAAQIYAAYIAAGRVSEGSAPEWMERSIREAIKIARLTDDAVVSDGEIDDEQAAGIVGRESPPSRHQ